MKITKKKRIKKKENFYLQEQIQLRVYVFISTYIAFNRKTNKDLFQ